MLSYPGDPDIERFIARRATGWRQEESAVILELEGIRDPDRTGIAAILAGAPITAAFDRAALAVMVLESGVVRLLLGETTPRDLGLIGEVEAAPLGVTTSDEGTLRLASERHGGYGPDPEDLTIEVTLDPLGLTILDAGGKPVVRLAADEAAADGTRTAPLAWMRWTDADGESHRASTISVALDAEERLFGLGSGSGPLNLVGSTRSVAPVSDGTGRPPFLLSSRGYGVLVHSAAGLSADLGVVAPAAYTLTVPEAGLDVLVFPSTWPRTALSGYARLTGRVEAPDASAFLPAESGARLPGDPISVTTPAPAGPPATPDAMRDRLREALAFGLATPGFWPVALGKATGSEAVRTRWSQLALLSPLVVPDGPLAEAVRSYADLRRRLLPYLLHCARETARDGLPMLRPLLLEFSWDPVAVEIDDQFLLGRDLLVAPVFSDSSEPVARRVYLPAYANWYDWWTGTLYEGRQWVETTAALHHLPLYVRAGTVIPVAASGTDGASTDGGAVEIGTPGEVTRLLLFAPRDGAIGASVELADDDMLGVEQERGDRKARVFVEGLPGSIGSLEIVGLPASTRLVDASASSITLESGDDQFPGPGGRWTSQLVRLDVRAFTAGLELAW